MGYDFWGEAVAFLGTPICEESFEEALARFEAAGRQLPCLGPLPLLETVARQVAAALEADPFALPGRHRLPPDLQRLVAHDIFRFGRLPSAADVDEEPPAKKRKEEEEQKAAEREVEPCWDSCYAPSGTCSEKEVAARMRLVRSVNLALHAPIALNAARGTEEKIRTAGDTTRPRLSMWHRSVSSRADDSFDGFHEEGPMMLRCVPNMFHYRLNSYRSPENDFMAVRPLHQPTVAERLLLVDAVRLLGVEPLGCESPRIFVATHTSGG